MSDHPLKRLLRKVTGRDAEATAIRESLEEVIEESERESPALSAQERVMLGNLLKFGELTLRDIMVPRAEILAVDEGIGLADLLKLFREAQHSRLPVYRETLDDPTGLIHVKDVLGLLEPEPGGAYCLSPHARIGGLRRPILFAPPSMRALDLLLKMQATHTHLALVIDEYGGTDGLVSIEDIIEEIVGDIADEHDEDAATLKPDGAGYVADARMDLDDFQAQTGHDLLVETGEERDIDSLGGLVVSLLGRVPLRGEIVAHPDGTEFQVLEADPRRVRKLQSHFAQIPRNGMNVLSQTGGWIGERRGLLFAFAAGAVSATGFAPLELFPALLLGYAALVVLLDGAHATLRPVRRAVWLGWAFYFGQFLVGWHWIAYAFLIYPGVNLWQLPFALLLPAGVALFGALACATAMFFWREGPGRIFIFACMAALSEWLRGHLFTGFPWNLSGYGWGASLALMQSASLMGAYGLSFLTILLGASLAELAARRWRTPAALLALFALLWGYGAHRLDTTPLRDVPGVTLRLVQPDIPQAEKYVRALMLRNWQRLLELSIQPPAKNQKIPTHIIWPEAATGFPIARSAGALEQIALLTARGQSLITGSDRVLRDAQGLTAYNSLYLFRPGGAPPLTYDKFHLVPFGEYLPFAHVLNYIGISQLTVGSGFQSGDHPHVLAAGIAPPLTPLICYEVIFPHAVVDPAEPRPGWLVNITDDSWFGPWAGPRQHFLTARVRAIEEGLPIARAANSGISAVIDPLGRAHARLDLNKMGVVDAGLPVALAPPLYARFGDLIFLVFMVTGGFIGFALGRK